MLLSVIVPVYNEEKTINQVLRTLASVPLEMEVIVIDDASTDQTWAILQRLSTQSPFNTYRFIRHTHNQGKGAGLKTGFALATGTIVTIQDADMEYDPMDLVTLVQVYEQANNPRTVVYGVRNLSSQKWTTRLGNRFLTQVTNLLFGSHIQDMETCYKLMPGSLAHSLPMTGRRFEIEPEITACILKQRYTILESPISYTPRKEKKLSPFRDGWPALAMLCKQRFQKSLPVVHSNIDTPQTVATPVGTKV